MKYMVGISGGNAVVSMPRMPTEEYYDDLYMWEDELICKAIDAGLDVGVDEETLRNEFDWFKKNFPGLYDDDDEYAFYNFIGDNMLIALSNGMYIDTGWFDYKPMPPNTAVGLINPGEKPKFTRYGGIDR